MLPRLISNLFVERFEVSNYLTKLSRKKTEDNGKGLLNEYSFSYNPRTYFIASTEDRK